MRFWLRFPTSKWGVLYTFPTYVCGDSLFHVRRKWLPSLRGSRPRGGPGGPGVGLPRSRTRRLSSASPSGPAGNGPGRGAHECEKPRVFLWGCVGLGRECFGYAKAPWGVCSEGLPVRVMRRRATLPHPVGCSTIAVPGLSFRVRNGTGRLTWAMAAANLLLYGQTLGSAGLWRPGNRTADADMSMFRLVARQCSLPSGAVCRRKMRSNRQGLECWCCLSSVSTGRLHPSRGFHVRPIDHVFCMGTTGTRRFHGMLILEQASRLDAFSGYPFRT